MATSLIVHRQFEPDMMQYIHSRYTQDKIVHMNGVFLDLGTLDSGDLDLSELKETLPDWNLIPETQGEHTLDAILNADIVVSNKVLLGKKELSQTKNLKLICVAATGTNNIDLDAAKQKNIVVCNARGYATASVVEHVFGLLFQLTRNLPRYESAVRQGKWQQSSSFCLLDYPIQELSGKTLGIIGYGELGRAVASAASAFGMNVLIAERKSTPPRQGRSIFETVLREADVISVHCPLNTETENLLGTREFDAMKPEAILIHTARGGIVNEQALFDALSSGHLGGAGVDVLSKEPPGTDNPLLKTGVPNLIVTPHIAWASRESRQRLIGEVSKNIRAFVSGSCRNQVY